MNLKEKKYLLLDLDGVCYGKHNNYSLEKVFGQVSQRMTQFISERLKINTKAAKKLSARRLIIMSDVEGVLDNNKKLISEISTDRINELIKNKTISGGMIVKIQNCLDVVRNGVKGVCIIDGRLDHSILFELLSDKGSGTLIRL